MTLYPGILPKHGEVPQPVPMKDILAEIANTPNTINELTEPLPEGIEPMGVLSESFQRYYCWYHHTLERIRQELRSLPVILKNLEEKHLAFHQENGDADCGEILQESAALLAKAELARSQADTVRQTMASLIKLELEIADYESLEIWQDGKVTLTPKRSPSFSPAGSLVFLLSR